MRKLNSKEAERRLFPIPKSELGEPKRKFSETFSAMPMLKERFETELEKLRNSRKD